MVVASESMVCLFPTGSGDRIPCFSIYRDYYLRPLILSAVRHARYGTIIQSGPFFIIIAALYAGYWTLVSSGSFAVPLLELRGGMLACFSAMYFFGRRQPRSTAMFHCTTSVGPANIMRLQALYGLSSPVALSCIVVALSAPSILYQVPGPVDAIIHLANDIAILSVITSASK